MSTILLGKSLITSAGLFAPASELLRQMREDATPVVRGEVGEFVDSWSDKTDFELDLLDAIGATGLSLQRAPCTLSEFDHRSCSVIHSSSVIYSLDSTEHHASLKFEPLPFRAGVEIHALALLVDACHQGNFFTLRRFVNLITKALFGLRRHAVYRIYGRLVPNTFPLRTKKTGGGDWREELTPDGQTKLAKLYERLGCVRIPYASGWTVALLSPKALDLYDLEDPRDAQRIRKQIAANVRHRR